MTRRTNSRIAGFTFLLYIAVGITTLVLSGRATGGEGTAAKLASIAQHEIEMRLVVFLSLLTSFCAIVLGVTLWAITREEDPDLAMLGLGCRLLEALPDGISTTLALLWLTTASGAAALDAGAKTALGAYLLRGGGGTGAIFFAVGSTLFAWLLLRGRVVPVALARLGVVASLLLVAVLPLQLAGFAGQIDWFGPVTWLVWLPALVFELWLAVWLILKGAAAPALRPGELAPYRSGGSSRAPR